MNNFPTQRDQWLEEVIDFLHPYAIVADIDYYTYQTTFEKENPDLLIIGINPGGNGSYHKILKEKNLTRRTPESMLYELNLLVEKPYWEYDENGKPLTGNNGTDNIRLRLGMMFNKDNQGLHLLKKTEMTNFLFMNTPKEKDIKSKGISKQIQQFCIDKVIELIEILNPKNILILTSVDAKLKKYGVKDIQRLKYDVRIGTLKSRIVYTVPHYSASAYYSYERANERGKYLLDLFI